MTFIQNYSSSLEKFFRTKRFAWERLWNDLFCVEWDVKSQRNQSVLCGERAAASNHEWVCDTEGMRFVCIVKCALIVDFCSLPYFYHNCTNVCMHWRDRWKDVCLSVHVYCYRDNMPSHFKFKEYCPVVFRNLRERFGIDEEIYLVSTNYWCIAFVLVTLCVILFC